MCKTSKKSLIKDINGLAEKEKEAKKKAICSLSSQALFRTKKENA